MARKTREDKNQAHVPSTVADPEAFARSMKDIEKKYGTGAVMMLGQQPTDFPHYPTGILSLDEAIGIGGLPKGRIVEIYGPESAGKTMISLQCIAAAQKKGYTCGFIDAENALNVNFAKKIGVQVEDLVFCQPSSGEMALDILYTWAMTGQFQLIVIDSVAALTPQAEIDGEMGDLQVGAQARMMSKAMRKCAPVLNQMGCTAIFINQLRDKIGVVYGNPETTPGGKALKFYASLRLDVRKVETMKKGTESVGNRIKVTVRKNKVAPPFRQAMFDLMFDTGVSREGQILAKATDYELIRKSGSWYSYNGEKIGQGQDNARQWLIEHPDITDQLEQAVYERMGITDDSDIDQHLSAEDADMDNQDIDELGLSEQDLHELGLD